MADGPVEHPRPLLRRAWTSLDGPWDLALDGGAFDRRIVVPFAPQTPASGVGPVGAVDRCTYRRHLRADVGDGRALLHLGAVDRVATVEAGGAVVGSHEGGYTGFTCDVTEALVRGGGETEVVVRVEDDHGDLDAPRGKQDWRPEPHAVWYPPTTGIWRTVWLERVGAAWIADVSWTADVDAMALGLRARVAGDVPPGCRLAVRVRHGDRVVAERAAVLTGSPEVDVVLPVGDGGIDDRFGLLWWPRRPVLLDVDLALLAADGTVLDEAASAAALRSVTVEDGRVLLNGRPYHLRLVLDQGYWPESGLTPPDTAALRRDLELTRALGFNGVRKHQKVEDPRYLAEADRLGLLVWVELPSAYRSSPVATQRLLREWAAVVESARSHPSVMAWVPVNESWGLPGLERDHRARALLEALAHVAGALDGTRPVSANDGWETVGGDLVGIHDYEQDPAVLAERYGTVEAVDRLLRGRSAEGRLADLDRAPAGGRAVLLSEFGGVALAEGATSEGWGYTTASSPEDLLRRYREQWAAVHASDVLAGACWTQLTDTYQEVNGLLRGDRTPKVPLDELAAATRGR